MSGSGNSFIKKLVGFSMVTWISFLLGFIASPIATRLFSTFEYGKLNKFNTYASLFSSICYLGLDQAYVRFFRELPEKFTKKSLLSFCTLISVLFSVLSSCILYFARSSVSTAIVGEQNFSVYLCFCIYSISLVLFRFLSLHYRMEQNVMMYTVQGVIHALFTRIAYLTIGFKSPDACSAILCLTVMMTLTSAVFLTIQRKGFTAKLHLQCSNCGFKNILCYAAPLMPLSILVWINNSVTTPILDYLMDENAIGIYSAALGLASSINIIQTGFNTYWAPYVFEHYAEKDNNRFYDVHKMMTCLLCLFALAITLFQVPVFLLLGKDFRSSVVFFPFLFLAPVCYCIGETTGMGITIAKKTYWTTFIFLFSAICNIVFCFLLIPILGMAGAAVSSAASAILTLSLRTAIGERYYKVLMSAKYLLFSIGILLLAAVANYFFIGAVKYSILVVLLLVALVFYRQELQSMLRIIKKIGQRGK